MSVEREAGLRLWESKYRFQKDMLPAFVGEVFGRKVSSFRRMRESAVQRRSSDFLDWKKLELHTLYLSRQ